MRRPPSPLRNQSDRDFKVCKDLLSFVEYARERDIKRGHRDNRIPQGDRMRLLKILHAPESLQDIEAECGHWAEWLSALARDLNLLKYDVKGKYMGYSSQSPSYPDNFIEVDEAALEKFLALLPSQKEKRILDVLIQRAENECHAPSLLGTQERFSGFGSGVGTASRMNLPKVRRQLLEMLARYEPGRPVPFSDLLSQVKSEAPRLIIDRNAELSRSASSQGRVWSSSRETVQGMECFYEYAMKRTDRGWEQDWRSQRTVSGREPDSFDRVEGRYLAFFLEEIPVLMQFVVLEYDQEAEHTVTPPLPFFIRSFTVTEKLIAMLGEGKSDLDRVKVTLTPDFKIFIEATLHPDIVLAKLAPYTTRVSQDTHTTVLELNRSKTLQSLTATPPARPPVDVLSEVVGKIPQNVLVDISEWGRQADKFELYEEVSILDMRKVEKSRRQGILSAVKDLIVREISDEFCLLRNPAEAHSRLEANEEFPITLKEAGSLVHFRRGSGEGRKKGPGGGASHPQQRKAVRLVESAHMGLACQDLEFLRALASGLQAAKVSPVLIDEKAHLIGVPESSRKQVRAILKALGSQLHIDIRYDVE